MTVAEITAEDVRWGKYKNYEGPWHPGTVKFQMPAEPTQADREIATITATEGGTMNAVNMYDRCILTVGIVQWAEAGQFSVSHLLASLPPNVVAEHLDHILKPLDVELRAIVPNRWRFCSTEPQFDPIDTLREQQRLFLLNSDGTQGSWDDESRAHATRWVVACSNLLGDPRTFEKHVRFTRGRLSSYFLVEPALSLYRDAPYSPLGNAFRAALLSFAANNPTWASRHLAVADQSSSAKRYSEAWLCRVLKELTFGPQCAIYPGRYNKIRPVIESLYGIDLPDLAVELQSWESKENGVTPVDVEEIQKRLIRLGYQLGNTGPDGNGADDKWGRLTQTALADFQSMYGLSQVDGYPSPETMVALDAVITSLGDDEVDNPGLREHVMSVVSASMDAVRRELASARRAKSI